jgi:hypothetical protein
MSDAEFDEKIEEVSKRQRRVYYSSCPDSCGGDHPEYVYYSLQSGELIPCSGSRKGAKTWHAIKDSPYEAWGTLVQPSSYAPIIFDPLMPLL